MKSLYNNENDTYGYTYDAYYSAAVHTTTWFVVKRDIFSVLFSGFSPASRFHPQMCDCGSTELGRWTGRVGGQIGDRLETLGRSALTYGAKRFKDWTGFGDYTLVGNSLVQGAKDPGLQIQTVGRFTRIKYREYLGEVVTHPADVGRFHVQKFRINPADLQTFPWLNPIATQFEQYKPMGILFEFKSTATDYSGTTASLGSVITATDYNVLDPPFTNKGAMLNNAYSQESKISESQIHGVECDPKELQRNVFYVSTTDKTSGRGPRDYDVGNFYIATDGGGLPAGQSVGSLWVHYDFVFFKEQIYGGLAAKNLLYSHYEYGGAVDPLAAVHTFVECINAGSVYSSTSPRKNPKTGIDLGISAYQIVATPSRSAFVFPQWLQGAVIKIEMSLVVATGVLFNIPEAIFNQDSLTIVKPLSDFPLEPNPSIWSEVVPFTTVTTSRARRTMYIQLNDRMETDGLLVINNWAENAVSTGNLQIHFTVMPQSEIEL